LNAPALQNAAHLSKVMSSVAEKASFKRRVSLTRSLKQPAYCHCPLTTSGMRGFRGDMTIVDVGLDEEIVEVEVYEAMVLVVVMLLLPPPLLDKTEELAKPLEEKTVPLEDSEVNVADENTLDATELDAPVLLRAEENALDEVAGITVLEDAVMVLEVVATRTDELELGALSDL